MALAPHQGYYVVAKGDTLYSIAWRYAFDYRDLAAWNDISAPYTIYPGQKILLERSPAKSVERAPSSITRSPGNSVAGTAMKRTKKTPEQPSAEQLSIHWRWPTHGKLLAANSPTLQKGVNIAGTTGQAIFAAAGGDVVYSGSGLLGYGKLIIIKHNEVYLSAYAHNEEILVKEGMRVSSGQKIATMGRDSDRRPLLHFEIRKEGKPVDPLKHLPKQQS
jgi:lipoprotein NlpD